MLSSLCGRVVSKSRNGVLDESEFGYWGERAARAPTPAGTSQIAEGVPYVEAKMFGQTTVDPFILRPNISKSAFRTLLLRAVGKYLADAREPYPVLAKSDVQLQVAQLSQGVQYHVLAIRALGHAMSDFSMSIDDQGRTFVRADPAQPQNPNPKYGRPFELLCQFPSLVHLQSCRCIYQEDVLYIIVFPRNAKSRSLRFSTSDGVNLSLPESVRKAAAGTHAGTVDEPSSPREVEIENGSDVLGDDITLAHLKNAFAKKNDDCADPDLGDADDSLLDERERNANDDALEKDARTTDLPDEDVDSEPEEPMSD
jgi:hypothetical protein